MKSLFPLYAIILTALLLQIVGLTFAVIIDPYIGHHKKRIMYINIAAIFSLVIQNFMGFMFDMRGDMLYARTLVGIYGYIIRPTIILLLLYVVSEDRKHTFAWILIIINSLIHLTAIFSDICFYIDDTNHFHRGPLGYTSHIVSFILLIRLMSVTRSEVRNIRRIDMAIPIFNSVLIVGSVVADSLFDYREFPATFLTITVASTCIFYYLWLHLQYVRNHERDMIAEQRIQIMMTQIQPHFLYNTLSTIQALCRIDPEKAFEVTERFGVYLRQNINTLSEPDLIPIYKEIEHTKVYADIERVRFPNINIIYLLDDKDFMVPPLTIQPLVENAIRHGVRSREDGRVSVQTKAYPDFHEIIIADNGVGFDVSSLDLRSDDDTYDTSHIGIKNVCNRVKNMCGGDLHVVSGKDGTTLTIRIPK